MVVDVGYVALLLSFVIAIYGALASVVGTRRQQPELVESARNSIYVVGGLVLLASLALWYALLTDDFQVRYVATHSERNLPLFYKLSAFWGGQAGSLLFWLLILQMYAVATALFFRGKHPALLPYVYSVLHVTSAFFTALMLFSDNP
ncbi:MAG TPA: heme lyase CcmF/NrfE family subunit, partial [Anaerolineae bacterium]|nr:heme lyase CcmF/NrfE family subunit [Anaerolineae bacterium]